jgi:glycosyltransferase involved in cell wall biosynthesis
LVIALAAAFGDLLQWAAMSVVWILTLLLIGLQKQPENTVVTVEVAQLEPVPFTPVADNHGTLVTVVVTTFNEGALLAQCLASVQGQTHTRLECLIVDDASTDDSVELALATLNEDPRFRVIRNTTNVGLAASRNVGLAAARGKLITFLDGDDFLYPKAIGDRVATFESAIDNGTLGGSFCNWHMVPEDAVPGLDPPILALRKDVTWLSSVEDNPFIASSPLILTSSARTVGGFNEDRNTAEDFDFWTRYLRHGFALRASSYVGIAYRQKRSSMYRSTIRDHVDIQLDVYKFNFRPLAPDERASGTPYVFVDQPSTYQQRLMRARRLCVGITVATHDGNHEGSQQLLAEFQKAIEPWMLWAEDWDGLIKKTATRLEAYDSTASDVRVAGLTRRVEMKTLPLLLASRPDTPAPA